MRRSMTITRTIEDVYNYASQAYDLIPEDHPHRDELRTLLIDQINDDLHDHDHTAVPYR